MNIFTEKFDSYVCIGDKIETTHNGLRFVAEVEHDSDHGAPWEECDGHGPVSDWMRRDKAPGELILCEDRGSKRFYDFAEACKIALRDGWGVGDRLEGESDKAYAARAARSDYEILRAWCNDEWAYCGIIVTVYSEDVELASESLWGIDYNYPGSDNSYLLDVANELASEAMPQAIEAAKAIAARLATVGES